MIRLRQTIERGMRQRWLGPLFVILFCLLMALMFMHAMHDSDHVGTETGEFCLGLTVMFSFLVVIRIAWRVTVPVAIRRFGRAPPAPRLLLLAPARTTARAISPPLRL